MATPKVFCQFRSNCPYTGTIRCLQTGANTLVQAHPACRCKALTHHIVIQRVYKLVAPRDCPVWPFGHPSHTEKLLASRQPFALFLYGDDILVKPSRYRRGCEGDTSRA